MKESLRERDRDNCGLIRTLKEKDVALAKSQAGFVQKEKDLQGALAKAKLSKVQLAEVKRSAAEAEANRVEALIDLDKSKVDSEAQYKKDFEDVGDQYEG